jgi:ribonuclease Z
MINFRAEIPLRIQDLSIKGVSLAGIGTSLVVPELSLGFDVAQGLAINSHLSTFLISHGHMDHAGGIPYVISQKALNKNPPPVFYLPESLIEPMHKILGEWAQIEQYSYQYSLTAAVPGQEFALKGPYFIRVFSTRHRTPSVGYSLVKMNHKLKPEFTHVDQETLIKLRKSGIPIQDDFDEILVSFTGDTQIEFLDLSPEVKKAKLLLLEVTYIDEKKSTEEAREWGHTHLDEIVPRLHELDCEQIVFIHKSRRYSDQYYNQILNQKIPKELHSRVKFLPEKLAAE